MKKRLRWVGAYAARLVALTARRSRWIWASALGRVLAAEHLRRPGSAAFTRSTRMDLPVALTKLRRTKFLKLAGLSAPEASLPGLCQRRAWRS